MHRGAADAGPWVAGRHPGAHDPHHDPRPGAAPFRAGPVRTLVTAVPVFTSVELSELNKACQGRSFAARRDAAIIAVFTATGIRLAELAGIRYHPDDPARSDLDLQAREIRIAGKAASPVPSGSATRRPAASTATCGPAPGTRWRTGRSCGWA